MADGPITLDASEVEETPSLSADQVEEAAPKQYLPEVNRAVAAVPKPPNVLDVAAAYPGTLPTHVPKNWTGKPVQTPGIGVPEVASAATSLLAPGTVMPGQLETSPAESVGQGVRELGTPGKRVTGALRTTAGALDAAAPLAGPLAVENPLTFARAMGEGYVGGKAAKYGTKAVGGTEEQQGIAEDIGQMAPMLVHAAVRPEVGVETSPEGTKVAGTVAGGRAGAGIAVTPEAVTVRGKVGPLEGSKTFQRGAKAAGPAIEPPTIEGQVATPSRAEIAEHLDRTNFESPEAAKASYVAEQQAQEAPVETNPKAPEAEVIPPTKPAPAVKESPAVPVLEANQVEESPKSATVSPKESRPPQGAQPAAVGKPAAEPVSKPAAESAPVVAKPGVEETAATPSKEQPAEKPEIVKGGKVELPDGRRATIEYAAPADKLPVVRLSTEDGEKVKLTSQKEIDGLKAATKYKYGSTQADVPEGSEAHGALETARSRISDSDLAGKGKDVGGNHVTVRYGIQSEDVEGVKKYLASLSPFEASLGKTDKFPPTPNSDGAAVIHAPIESPELQKINAELEKHGDFTEPSFKEYRPHATIAYVDPAKVGRYTGMSVTEGKKFPVNEIAITDKNGAQTVVRLGGTSAITDSNGKSKAKLEEKAGNGRNAGGDDASQVRRAGIRLAVPGEEPSSRGAGEKGTSDSPETIGKAEAKTERIHGSNDRGGIQSGAPGRDGAKDRTPVTTVRARPPQESQSPGQPRGEFGIVGPEGARPPSHAREAHAPETANAVVAETQDVRGMRERQDTAPGQGEVPQLLHERSVPARTPTGRLLTPEELDVQNQPGTTGVAKDIDKWQPPPELGAFPNTSDVGAKARAQVDKESGPLKRGEERRKVDRTGQQAEDKLFTQARKELGEDATTEQVEKRIEHLRKPATEAKPTKADYLNNGFGPRRKEGTPTAPVAKEPWQMTRAEWMAQRPAGTAPGMHAFYIDKALRKGEDVPAAVLKDYENDNYIKDAIAASPQRKKELEDIKARVAELEKSGAGERLRERESSFQKTVSKKVADKLRGVADNLEKQIEDKRRPMTQNPTPKRMAEYRSRVIEADEMERTQKAMRALADAHEAGTITPDLAALRSKEEIGRLVHKGLDTSRGGYYDRIPSSEYRDKSTAGKKLQEMIEGAKSPEATAAKLAKEKASKIAELEADVQFRPMPGYFPTPKPVVEKMLDAADIKSGMSVLEPSAGKGNIADAIRDKVPDAKLSVVEQAPKLQEILKLKDHNLVDSDFLEHDSHYDRIVMNPPFEKGADVEHVRHAFELLKPGGRLVAIMSPHAEFASDKKSVAFREWVDSLGGETEKLPGGSFKESGTGVASRMVTIDKPEATTPVAAEASKETKELREYFGVSRENLDAYDPAASVSKLGKHWIYKTLQGNDGPMYDTKREAIEAATGHKALKEEQLADPESFADIVSVRAGKSLDLIRKYIREGMSEMEAGRQAEKDLSGAAEGSKPRREVIPTAKKETAVGARVSGIDGSEGKLLTTDGERPTTFRVVEAASLVTSHDPHTFARNEKYPAGVQERAYDTSKEAQNRVIQQAQKYDPNYTINTNPDAVNGPPIITPDGIVLGGNSRAMSTARLYKAGNGNQYKGALLAQAGTFGLDKQRIQMMKAPVLVREVEAPKTQDEMRALGSALNKSMTGALGVSERAVSAGKAISRDTLANISGMLDGVGKDASLRDLLRERGKDVLSALVKDGAITERERPQFVDTATGGLSEEGKTFVERALLGSVVDDPRLMDSTPKAVLNKLDGSLAALSSIAPRTDAYNILPLLREALREHGEIAQRGTNVEDYLSQSGLFSTQRDPAVDALTRVLAGKSLSARERFRRFSEDANFDVQGQGTLGLIEQPSPAKAFNEAFGANLTDEDLENSILKAVQSEPTISANGGEEQTVRPSETGAGSVQRSEAGEPRPSGESGTGTPEEARPKTQLANLFSDETGSFEPGKVGDAAAELAGFLQSSHEYTTKARDLQRDLETLDTQKQADILSAVGVMKSMKKEGMDKSDDAAIYHNLENPNEKLSTAQKKWLDAVVSPIVERNEELYTQLTEGGIPIENYVHRVVKGKGGMLDRIAQGVRAIGQKATLSKSAPQTKHRTYMVLEKSAERGQGNVFTRPGNRVVVSVKGGQVTAWKNGIPENIGGLSSTEEGKAFEDKDGNLWTLKQATTKEIEQHTGTRYYHSALASTLASNIQLGSAVRAMRFLNDFKNAPDFHEVAWNQAQGPAPKGWKTTNLVQFKGYAFEPRTAEVLDHYYDRMRQGNFGALDQVGKFMRVAMLLNPIMHPMNVAASWAVERGATGLLPTSYARAFKAGNKAVKAVLSQNKDFIAALDAGAPLQSHREAIRDITKLFFDQLAEGLGKEEPWAKKIAEALGIEHGNLLNILHKFSSKAAWVANDIFFLQSAYEHQAAGMSLEDALKETGRVIPEYRVPTRILDSPMLSKLMTNRWATIFGSYHYGLLRSFGEIAKSALGAQEPPPGRTKAAEVAKGWDRLALLALMTMALYPALDEIAKKITKDKHARAKRFGPFAVVDSVAAVVNREQSVSTAAQRIITPAPQTKAAAELLMNREFYAGHKIYDPHATFSVQTEQLGRYLLDQLGQVGQAQKAQTSDQKRRFAYGQVGVAFRKTPAEKIAADIAMSKVGTEAEDPEDQKNRVMRREILDQLRKGNEQPLRDAEAKHEVSRKQIMNLERRSRFTPLQDTVHGFSYKEIRRVYDAANPEEKKELQEMVHHKLMNLLHSGRREDATTEAP